MAVETGITYGFGENRKPLTMQAKVCVNMLMLMEATLPELVRATGFPEKVVLEQVKFLRKEFDLRGNRKIGYKLSSDPEERLAMSRWIDTQY